MPENQPKHNKYVISAGSTHWLTDEHRLLAVTALSGMAHLPFSWSEKTLHGILPTQYGPLALLNPAMTDTPEPALAALVLSDRGPVALAVDRVSPLTQTAASADEHQPLEAMLQSLTRDFSVALPPVHVGSANDTSARIRFLLVQAGPDFRVALRASRISRIERCQKLYAVRGMPGDHQIVLSTGQLLHAQFLHDLLGGTSTTPDASWCLQIQGQTGTKAVLLSAIVGFIEAPSDSIRTLRIDGHTSHWLIQPEQDPLEIVLENIADETAPPQPSQGANEPLQTSPHNSPACQALRVDVGHCALVIPQDLLGPVTGPLLPVTRYRTRPQDWRVWHLDKLLGVQTTLPPSHALVLKLENHCVVLLCSQIRPLTSLQSFATVPSLPGHLAGLLQGLRITNGTTELLLSSHPQRRSLRALLRQRLRQARAGWVPPVSNQKETRTDHAQ